MKEARLIAAVLACGFAWSAPAFAGPGDEKTAAEAGSAGGESVKALSVDDCVAIALRRSARLQAAAADVKTWQAKVQEVDALLSPNIQATGFIAPMFGARGGIGVAGSYENDLTDWGPYAHADARVVLPLATFGRQSAAMKAAKARTAVQKQRKREIAHAVRRNVRKLYGLKLYAQSMLPSLNNAAKVIETALDKAREKYDEGTGEVTMADVMKLKYGVGEVQRYIRRAQDGAELAGYALRQAMGMSATHPLKLSVSRLSRRPKAPPPLDELVARAMKSRPEILQVRHGEEATAALIRAENLANMPVLFAALVGQVDWSPVRPSGYSSVTFNTFNDYFVGVAVGLRLSTTPGVVSAKEAAARAKQAWVLAQKRRAATGIPLTVRKAWMDVRQQRALARIAGKQVKAARKWMTFAATAWATGTGEPKDVLEGVGAYLKAKNAYYEHLLGGWQAQAELEQATGADDVKDKGE